MRLDSVIPLAVALACIVVPSLLLPGISWFIARESCLQTAERLAVQAEYGVFTGCMVRDAGEWLPLSTYLSRTIEQNVKVR